MTLTPQERAELVEAARAFVAARDRLLSSYSEAQRRGSEPADFDDLLAATNAAGEAWEQVAPVVSGGSEYVAELVVDFADALEAAEAELERLRKVPKRGSTFECARCGRTVCMEKEATPTTSDPTVHLAAGPEEDDPLRTLPDWT